MSKPTTPNQSKFLIEDNNLKPLKLILHGPPASGKTEAAKRICRRYGAYYISVKTMIDETLEELRQNIINIRNQAELKAAEQQLPSKEADESEEEVEDEEEEELEGGGGFIDVEREVLQYEEQIREITVLLDGVDHKLPDDYVVRLMRVFLAKPKCQEHGYVLDGFPKNLAQARELFGQASEVPKESMVKIATEEAPPAVAQAEEVPGEGMQQIADVLGNIINIMPDFVVSLLADDQFLCQRIMKLPEKEIQGTHYDEPNMIRRLLEFRRLNTSDNTVLNFFDEAEIHPIVIDLTEDGADDIECVLNYLYKAFGPPIPGIGLTDEEEQELCKLEMEQRKLKHEAYLLEKQMAEETARREYEDKMEKWAATLEKLQMEEEKIIAAESEPLRYYLMKYVFPTLTKGLSEIARIKPDDPVDYLAEFLFKENPEGKMFDPSYTRTGEEILQRTQEATQNI